MISHTVTVPQTATQAQRALWLVAMTDNFARDCAETFAAMPPWSTYEISAGVLMDYFAQSEPGAPRFAVVEADAPDTAIGAMGLRLNWLKGPYLQFLGLKPQHQSVGLGRALVSHVETDARAARANSLWVAVSEINTRAFAFYETAGFEMTARLNDLVVEGRTELLLRKRLGPS